MTGYYEQQKQRYVDKIKEIRNKTDMMEGCKNRMCITDNQMNFLICVCHLHYMALIYII